MKSTVEGRNASMRKIQEKAFQWAEKQFDVPGYIYYERDGRFVECYCGVCGAKYVGATRPSPMKDPFEQAAEHIIPSPRHNGEGTCESCGTKTKYKSMGKVKDKVVAAKGRWAIGQRLGKEEFVFRIFDTQQIMHKKCETKYDHMEYMRIFLRPGKTAQKDYFVHDPWAGGNKWIDHNLGGLRNIPQPDEALIYPGTYTELKNTSMFKYIPRQREAHYPDGLRKRFPEMRYYEAAAHYNKDFEMIVKGGPDDILYNMVWKLSTGYRSSGKTYYDRLGVYKERAKGLDKYSDMETIKIYQAERKSGKHWKEEEIEAYKKLKKITDGTELKTLESLFRYASAQKFCKYIDALPKDRYGRSYQAKKEYFDYLHMRKKAGYDMSDLIILFPKDMHRRHNEMVLELEKEKIDKRKAEVLKKYTEIAKKYPKLDKKYSAAAAGFFIRPAKDAAEIVTEGRLLHHCVGGDMYLSKHNKGQSTILFLRHLNETDVPFVTVEIKGNKIIQWYGEYDKKPDKELIDSWLKAYCEELEKRQKKEKSVRKTAKTVQNHQKTA